MKVMKFGGSVLKDPDGINRVVDIIQNDPEEKVIVVSALNGITDMIYGFLADLESGEAKPREMSEFIKKHHFSVLLGTVMDSTQINKINGRIDNLVGCWERVAFGALYTEELTPRCQDILLSLGERLSVILLEGALRDRGIAARALEMDRLGCVTDGEYGHAKVDIEATLKRLPSSIEKVLSAGEVPILTGFFGADENGNTTIFGRGGTDYSAAMLANILNANVLELWKDVDGFFSSDPKLVDHAKHISHLSYAEAAELAYFGAKILHPLAIWPVSEKDISIWVGNIICDDGTKGTWITSTSKGDRVVKSVANTNDIGILKIHGAGLGHQPGILSRFVAAISDSGTNIMSVITSQTCIAILLERDDLEPCYRLLQKMSKSTGENIELLENMGLIGIVGDGISKTKGIASKIFGSVANDGINVDMISSGASENAYYFIVEEQYLEDAVKAIHRDMFDDV